MNSQTLAPRELLKKYFGYDAFREGQAQVIEAILSGRDALCVMPTGAGKSVCYQIPALMLPGVTLVVSPLISLMKDQVSALKVSGIAGAYLNSSLTQAQYAKALRNAEQGLYTIIYVAPERLETEEFRAFSRRVRIAMVAVDEAHCVSQWGQDFRPSYLLVRTFVESLPNRPIVAAFTATATERVRQDIARLLALQSPCALVTGFDRPNLFFEVRRVAGKEKDAQLLSILREMKGKSGIIYCGTRKQVDTTTELLAQAGYGATRYHAGLGDEERRANQDAFLFDQRPVMVATNAFGMGIDKSNVSYVIHYNMPKDIESYYQEAGRAGRDGLPARCILLYAKRDVLLCDFLINKSFEREDISQTDREFAMEQAKQRLAQMTFYATGSGCLRAFILRYFGEPAEERCGGCGSCLRDTSKRDISDIAGVILDCIMETGERYGITSIVGILLGAKDSAVLSRGLDRKRTYGALPGMSAKELTSVIDAMLAEGYLSRTADAYRSLQRGRLAGEIARGLPCVVAIPLMAGGEEKAKKAREPRRSPANAANEGERTLLMERLVRLRLSIAKEQNVPAYVVFTNATLESMCTLMPRTRAEMLTVSGVGQKKLELYGDAFLEEIERCAERTETDTKK